jgi:hypothetical protein
MKHRKNVTYLLQPLYCVNSPNVALIVVGHVRAHVFWTYFVADCFFVSTPLLFSFF